MTSYMFAGSSGIDLLPVLLLGYGLLKCRQLVETLISLCRWIAHSKPRIDMCALGVSSEHQVIKERGNALGWQQSMENPSSLVVGG